MIDKKLPMVKKALECCSEYPAKCDECPYVEGGLRALGCKSNIFIQDALEVVTYFEKKQQMEVSYER